PLPIPYCRSVPTGKRPVWYLTRRAVVFITSLADIGRGYGYLLNLKLPNCLLFKKLPKRLNRLPRVLPLSLLALFGSEVVLEGKYLPLIKAPPVPLINPPRLPVPVTTPGSGSGSPLSRRAVSLASAFFSLIFSARVLSSEVFVSEIGVSAGGA